MIKNFSKKNCIIDFYVLSTIKIRKEFCDIFFSLKKLPLQFRDKESLKDDLKINFQC